MERERLRDTLSFGAFPFSSRSLGGEADTDLSLLRLPRLGEPSTFLRLCERLCRSLDEAFECDRLRELSFFRGEALRDLRFLTGVLDRLRPRVFLPLPAERLRDLRPLLADRDLLRLSGFLVRLPDRERLRLAGFRVRLADRERLRLGGLRFLLGERLRLSGFRFLLADLDRLRLSGLRFLLADLDRLRLGTFGFLGDRDGVRDLRFTTGVLERDPLERRRLRLRGDLDGRCTERERLREALGECEGDRLRFTTGECERLRECLLRLLLLREAERDLRRRAERDLERLRLRLLDLPWDLRMGFSSSTLIRRPFRSVPSSFSMALRMSLYDANSTTPSLRFRLWASA